MERTAYKKQGILALFGSTGVRLFAAAIVSGLGMWIVAGLYHNLLLPLVDPDVQAHHEGFDIMLYAYLILGSLMVYLHRTTYQSANRLVGGVVMGMFVGVLWTFPHGLAMAGIHGASIPKEIMNSLWHLFEQGVGGLLVALVIGLKLNWP